MNQNEKRFTHKKWYNERQLFDGDEAFAIVDVYIQAEHICDKLNALHEENVELKQQVNELIDLMIDSGIDFHISDEMEEMLK